LIGVEGPGLSGLCQRESVFPVPRKQVSGSHQQTEPDQSGTRFAEEKRGLAPLPMKPFLPARMRSQRSRVVFPRLSDVGNVTPACLPFDRDAASCDPGCAPEVWEGYMWETKKVF